MASEIRISTTFYIIGDTLYFSRDIGEKSEASGRPVSTTDESLNEIFEELLHLGG